MSPIYERTYAGAIRHYLYYIFHKIFFFFTKNSKQTADITGTISRFAKSNALVASLDHTTAEQRAIPPALSALRSLTATKLSRNFRNETRPKKMKLALRYGCYSPLFALSLSFALYLSLSIASLRLHANASLGMRVQPLAHSSIQLH